MSDVHVVVLNWNGGQDTLECLRTLSEQEGVSINCLVVDNNSTDHSVESIRAQFPEVMILENKKNLGYPGGMNSGIRFALDQGAENILILNNDVLADAKMIKHLLDHLGEGVGVVAPAIYYASHPDQIWSIGGNIHPLFLEMTPGHTGNADLSQGPVDRDFLTGCAMLVRAQVFLEAGLFDEKFFPGYYEDLDFCLRIRQHNFRMLLIPQARLWHKVSRSSGGEYSPRVIYLKARNTGYYFRKHMKFYHLPFVISLRLLSALKTSVLLGLKKNTKCLSAYYEGLADGWVRPATGKNKYLDYYSAEK